MQSALSLALAALVILCAELRAASNLSLDLRYILHQTQTHGTAQTLTFEKSTPRTDFRAMLRGRVTNRGLETLSYSLQGAYRPVSWIGFHARLVHRDQLRYDNTSSTVFASLRLGCRFPRFLSYFIEGGAYFRSLNTESRSLVPRFSGTPEKFWAVAIGLAIHPTETFRIGAQLSTIETLDIYNLANPYIETDGEFRISPTWFGRPYFRYQTLIGFGRLDAFTIGFQTTFWFTAPGASRR
jgi:hypothetical protein